MGLPYDEVVLIFLLFCLEFVIPYILGIDKPVKEFVGKIIAIIHREDDVEEKWVVVPENITFTKDEIMEQVYFQEKYFKSGVRM